MLSVKESQETIAPDSLAESDAAKAYVMSLFQAQISAVTAKPGGREDIIVTRIPRKPLPTTTSFQLVTKLQAFNADGK